MSSSERDTDMTIQEIDARIEKLNAARQAGEITGAEWEAHMQALCELAQEEAA